MNTTIYNSSNEGGLLRSNGPYRITSTDNSFRGVTRVTKIEVTTPVTIGEVTTYGPTRGAEPQAEKKESEERE